jgi:signal transduction histidine kinase
VEKELQRERAMQQYSEIMFASVSHELRTPINIINNCISCLKVRADEGSMKWLDIAATSASFLLSLVNDTLVSIN